MSPSPENPSTPENWSARGMNEELKDPNTTPERREILKKAVEMAHELSDYCAKHDVGHFRIEGKGNVAWAPALKSQGTR